MIALVLLKFYYRQKGEVLPNSSEEYNPLIFLLPACCDMTGTSLMYMGLTMTDASVFQMLRGSVVIFTGVLSVVFLGRKLQRFHWAGMFLVLIGVAVVGYASISSSTEDATPAPTPNPATDPFPNCGTTTTAGSSAILGNGLIIAAQVITAVQMCLEEKLVGDKDIPALAAVGWEGFWGFCVICCVLVGMNYIHDDTKPTCKFEDAADAFTQMSHSAIIVLAILGNILSIAFFNFFGISVTKAMSAAHRMVLDSVRTFVIWGVSLAIGWEDFKPLQVVGFVVLLTGTAVYNEIVKLPGPWFSYPTGQQGVEDATTCFGLWNVKYVYDEDLVEKEEPEDAEGILDDPMLPGTPKTPGKRSSMHRSFTTTKDLHGSFASFADLASPGGAAVAEQERDPNLGSSFISHTSRTSRDSKNRTSFSGIPR